MSDVPSIAVFCSESIEYFPDMASKIFVKPFDCSSGSNYCQYHTFDIPRSAYPYRGLYFIIIIIIIIIIISVLI